MKNLANRLQLVIVTLKIGKGDFADAGGVHAATLTGYLKGVTLPNQETLAKWVLAYDLNAHWLLTGEGDMLRDVNTCSLGHPVARLVDQVTSAMARSGADELAVLNAARAMLDGEINKLLRARGGYGVAEPGPGVGLAAEEPGEYACEDPAGSGKPD